MIYFAQIREDAAVERAHFQDAARILTIASGGCVALSLLRDQVQRVDAVDLNPAQTALLRQKARAMERLSLPDFLVACGERAGDRAALFAGAGIDVCEETAQRGLLHVGATERFYRFLGQNLRRNVLNDRAWEALLHAEDLDAQRAWLERYTSTDAWRTAITVLLSRATHEHFFPPAMFAHVGERSFGELFFDRFAAEVSTRRVADNPFLHQLLYGRYGDARPAYLTEDGYRVAKRNLHKLSVTTASLTDVRPDASYDALGLSNVFDWASAEEADAIAKHVDAISSSRAKVVVRQMLDARPLPLRLEATTPAPDRAMLYREVTCGELA